MKGVNTNNGSNKNKRSISYGVLALILLFLPSLAVACPECWWEISSEDAKKNSSSLRYGVPSIRRYHHVMNLGIPEKYNALTNPLPLGDKALEKGRVVFEQHCASCHGEGGRGDGASSDAMTPSPADLKQLSHMMSMTTDAYMYWTIVEGGKPIDSNMPAFNDLLGDEEIWSLIHYIGKEI